MITSKDNERVKYLKKLKQKKNRDKEGVFLVFGDHLLEEASKHGVIINIYTSNPSKEGILVSNEIMKEINFTETPYDILAICKKQQKSLESDKILLLDDVQDPDNVGALLRSASAFGFLRVIVSLKTADVYNEKAIRASQGAVFHLCIERRNVRDALIELKKDGYSVIVTDVKNSGNIEKKPKKLVLVLGNEGNGVSREVYELADETVTIETKNVESLNVAVAGSILMYEWSK